MNKKELVIKVLDTLNSDDSKLQKENLSKGMTLEEYGTLLEVMLDEGLIKDVKMQRAGIGNKVAFAFANDAKITIKGIEYLEQNK